MEDLRSRNVVKSDFGRFGSAMKKLPEIYKTAYTKTLVGKSGNEYDEIQYSKVLTYVINFGLTGTAAAVLGFNGHLDEVGYGTIPIVFGNTFSGFFRDIPAKIKNHYNIGKKDSIETRTPIGLK